MHLLRYFILLTLPLVFSACRKDTAVNYSITGRVTDADDGTPLQDVSIQIEKQVVQNGVYGNTYQNAMTTTTDGSER